MKQIMAFLCLMSFALPVQAGSVYGITYFLQEDAPPSSMQGPELLNSQQLTASVGYALTGSANYSSSLSGSINDGFLQATASAMVGSGGESYANMDLYYYDTFTMSGPAGTYGQLKVEMTFDGSGVESSDCYSCAATNTFNLLENGTVIPGSGYGGIISTLSAGPGVSGTQTNSTVLTLEAGTSVVLGELLQIRDAPINQYNYSPYPYVTFSDPAAYITVQSLTSGFSYSTDSGLDYSGTATPEPASALLLLAGGALLGVSRCFRIRKTA